MEVIITYAPREREKRVKVVTFKLDVDILREVDEIAESLGMSRSELIRKAIEDFIRRKTICAE
ncbi:MAG: ribbon-helix-helix domain-containing protein [Desulfurococcales archaeon]|nr:ribbon-helix-helix domain-containing protein [Desulfurococcales archaeon]